MKEQHSIFDLEIISSYVLRGGVIVSCSLIAVGVIALLVDSRSSPLPQGLQQMVQSDYAKPTLDAGTLIHGVLAFSPIFVIQLGLIILLATPVVRTIVSAIYFAVEKDKMYLAISIFILTVLFLSIFVIGPSEAAG